MPMRRTKIVCTIGPASNSEQQIEALNFSHGKHEEHAVVIERIRAIARRLERPIAILQDLQGPKIRVGALSDGKPIVLTDGSEVIITTHPVEGDTHTIPTTYKDLARDVKAGDHILLDDGLLELQVLATSDDDVRCRVVHGGLLKEHKGINLPGVAVSAPALTEKDREDLRFGIAHGVDYVALSFVRTPQDILDARQAIENLHAEHVEQAVQAGDRPYERVPLIAKLEKPEAIAHLDTILEVVDGVMVARGDLGVEMSPEKVPHIQKEIIARCNRLGLPMITATQMLESMITNPTPTRAEVNDVYNAILDGTDAVMLSAETASGEYPIEAVRMMVRIAKEAEEDGKTAQQPQCQKLTQAHAVSHAARALAEEASVQAIVVFTRTGTSAHLISKDRPRTPILAYTPSPEVYRRLALWWGVWSYEAAMGHTTDELISVVEHHLIDNHLMSNGDHVVIMGGLPIASRARTNFVKLHKVDPDDPD
jgi:pyruvate kinase